MEKIEVTFNLMRAWSDGIRMFPALKIGNDMISGLIISREKVREFVEAHIK